VSRAQGKQRKTMKGKDFACADSFLHLTATPPCAKLEGRAVQNTVNGG